jgi:hypothetical protein
MKKKRKRIFIGGERKRPACSSLFLFFGISSG